MIIITNLRFSCDDIKFCLVVDTYYLDNQLESQVLEQVLSAKQGTFSSCWLCDLRLPPP